MKIIVFICGLVLGILIGIISGAFAMHFLYSPFLEPPRINYQTIYFPKAGTKIYTTAMVWGITGNYEEVKLCSEPFQFGKVDQTDPCIAFHTNRIFYKKDGPAGLQVYVPIWAVPPDAKNVIGGIQVSVKELEDLDSFKNYEHNFEEYGLSTIASP